MSNNGSVLRELYRMTEHHSVVYVGNIPAISFVADNGVRYAVTETGYIFTWLPATQRWKQRTNAYLREDRHLVLHFKRENGKEFNSKFHQLVMVLFHRDEVKRLLECNDRLLDVVINHKDGEPTHNSSRNLEFCTTKENNRHARLLKEILKVYEYDPTIVTRWIDDPMVDEKGCLKGCGLSVESIKAAERELGRALDEKNMEDIVFLVENYIRPYLD